VSRNDQGLAFSWNRHRVVPRTLCFVTHGDQVLLLRGAPHKRLWAGRYNGVGGHVEPEEDIRAAALREIKEETGLTVRDLRLRGVIHADTGDPVLGVLVFVFTAEALETQVLPSSEGIAEWLPAAELPVADLVEDLPVLLPKVLTMGPDDPPFFALYSYDEQDRLVVSFAMSQ
jgi:8-oxo-dGTP diphosphatase